MFCFLEDLAMCHELRFTADGVVIADPNGIDARDIPPENLHESAERSRPHTYLDVNDIADGLAADYPVWVGGTPYWQIQPGEEHNPFDDDQASYDETDVFDAHFDVSDDDLDEDDVDTEEDDSSPMVVPMRSRQPVPDSASRRLVRNAPKGLRRK